MARIIKNPNSHGSLKNLQLLINNNPDLIQREISDRLGNTTHIEWKSPLESDNFAEYRDNDFLKRLEIDDKITFPLNQFWPVRGPQWDALGKSNETVFLIEAKANIPEMVSPSSKATNQSLELINKSFDEVKEYLNIRNEIDWSKTFYQYANRVAHLYFLIEKNKIDAHLIFIYFIKDKSVNGTETIEEWKGAIKTMELYLGLSHHKLKKYIHDIFIDIEQI